MRSFGLPRMLPRRAWKGQGRLLDESKLIVFPYHKGMPTTGLLLKPLAPCKRCGLPVDRYRTESGHLVRSPYCADCRKPRVYERKPARPCKQCNQPVDRYYSKSGTLIMPVFCVECRTRRRHPKGEDHWHWRGGERSLKNGYVRVYVAPGKRTLEHRAVWEAAYGTIPRGLHVHHIDGDKTNNRLDNLALAGNSAHQGLHRHERALGDRWSLEHAQCLACLTTERPHQARGLCKRCYDRLKKAGSLS